MGLKKRSKVSAEFSMSSLTDIIFLLLIFFMLTSNLVAPNAINLKMPGTSQSSSPPSNEKITDVRVSQSGSFYVDGDKVSTSSLRSRMRNLRGKTITISPHSEAPIEKVATVMDMAMTYSINSILAAEQ